MHKARFAGLAVALFASLVLAAAADAAPVLTLQLQATKAFRFSWTGVPGISHYRLLEDPTGSSGFTQVGPNFSVTQRSYEHIVPLYRRVNARYIVQACAIFSCTDSNTVHASAPLTEAIGYFKASNPGQGNAFGGTVALSSDGTTLAVGAAWEDSAATGVGGDQSDDTAPGAGAVYVFVRNGGGSAWVQQAYIKASNTDADDLFGIALALSADGSTLAVSAEGEDSSATGVNGNQADDSASFAGAVYVYARVGSVWSQQAYIKASDTEGGDAFGAAVALSGNGAVLAVGAALGGINDAGNVHVFARSGSAWSQQAYIQVPKAEVGEFFGTALDLSNDGLTLAVGGDHVDNRAVAAGAVYVFVRVGSVWTQQAYIKPSNADPFDHFGAAVALSGNGLVLAVGAEYEDSAAVGVDGDSADESAADAGAVFVYERSGSLWTQQAYIKASNTGAGDYFGHGVALSDDGHKLAVGAFLEDGADVGINGDETIVDTTGVQRGAAYVFAKNNGLWTQRAYVKPSNTPLAAFFGQSLALAGNGGTLAVGAPLEFGSSSGINGPQYSPTLSNAGAVYVY